MSDSDEIDDDVASFLLCYMFYCLCVVYCVCVVYCLNLSLFMSIISLHVVNIFLIQVHNHSFFSFTDKETSLTVM